MRLLLIFSFPVFFFNCNSTSQNKAAALKAKDNKPNIVFQKDSWQYFLQHLPVINAPVKDYTGRPVLNQKKHAAVINYDVGTSDLQQCADAIMRLRAEYLFAQQRFGEIGFHFCSGLFYSWDMYCKGLKPAIKGNIVTLAATKSVHQQTHKSLRSYLDIVYTYANTISLCKELKPADVFEVGTVIITPGSPGHACIIIDEAIDDKGKKIFKLAESYMPAQSIYILNNPYDESINPWYKLEKGEIVTASYDFTDYQLKKFE